ncbi:hypothetical protein EYC80_007789 [Monilinia laxa]|uniref:Uncharacterized protein n=1 Tax=Monilinia laxa TaxID=61186 RepID=A0A5N6JWZ8_MONLA|nr:hypothetical protein EYC80_007789 [Monilinia laxa]
MHCHLDTVAMLFSETLFSLIYGFHDFDYSKGRHLDVTLFICRLGHMLLSGWRLEFYYLLCSYFSGVVVLYWGKVHSEGGTWRRPRSRNQGCTLLECNRYS